MDDGHNIEGDKEGRKEGSKARIERTDGNNIGRNGKGKGNGKGKRKKGRKGGREGIKGRGGEGRGCEGGASFLTSLLRPFLPWHSSFLSIFRSLPCLLCEVGEMTFNEATAWCDGRVDCTGFTFQSTHFAPAHK
jgi:hypothetical protein